MGCRASGRSIAAVGAGCAAVALLSSSVAHAFRTVADDPDFPTPGRNPSITARPGSRDAEPVTGPHGQDG